MNRAKVDLPASYKRGDEDVVQGAGIMTVRGQIDGTAITGANGYEFGKGGHGYSMSV